MNVRIYLDQQAIDAARYAVEACIPDGFEVDEPGYWLPAYKALVEALSADGSEYLDLNTLHLAILEACVAEMAFLVDTADGGDATQFPGLAPLAEALDVGCATLDARG
jgi:hypothetical protein